MNTKKKSWRSILLAIVSAMVLVVTGCASNTENQGGQKASDGEEVVITVWGLSDYPEWKASCEREERARA